MAQLTLNIVTRQFGTSAPAVDRVTLDVADREFVALLGPSGCGKTTLLRLIAGFEVPDAGHIAIDGDIVAGPGRFLPPEDRDLGMVFQSYALWPHMNVAQNVAFALEIRRLPKSEIKARVNEALEKVGLAEKGNRRPSDLSGGQRQRVALARCLAMRPRLVLLDEPLANLDAHLRETMQAEFRRFHKELGTTFIYVTHDQTEAMALADRVAVMNDGRLEQVAAPELLWRESASRMVAEFIGGGAIVPARAMGPADHGRVVVDLWSHRAAVRSGSSTSGLRSAVLRPRDLAVAGAGEAGIDCRLVEAFYQGGQWRLTVAPLADESLILSLDADRPPTDRQLKIAVRDGWLLPEAAA